ncbi:ABC transporter substrate-binding protein [Mesorhizobium sp. L-8-10]|uniref:ABC transporter substrate-binding protein n=1 Tax=Mesorhizobium sp. L-8-10 TaxID=2744523 RepID=UPI001926159B|nr:ABC transporter substrate-binding protein [Mesorhizobium sp. L-8-10]
MFRFGASLHNAPAYRRSSPIFATPLAERQNKIAQNRYGLESRGATGGGRCRHPAGVWNRRKSKKTCHQQGKKMAISRRSFLWTGTSALGLAAVGLTGSALAQDAPRRGGVLVVGLTTNPPSFDPHKSAAFATTAVTEHIFGCLLRWDRTGTKVEPDLAQSYEIVDDLTYKFVLREGVKFHNGETLRSSDVKFTFDRIANPDTASPWRSLYSPISAIETPDDRTVIFRMSKPFAPFLNLLATVKYSAIVSEVDIKPTNEVVAGSAGTGPFKFVSFQANSNLVLTRNDDYYEEGLPYLDGLELRIIPDEGSRVAALRSNTCQLTSVTTPEVVQQIAGQPGFETPESPANMRVVLLQIDQRTPPFDDVRVRRAFSLAMNRQQIADVVWRGRAAPTAAIPPAQAPYGFPSEEVPGLPYQTEDLEQAKALLAEAGYPDGFETKLAVSPATFSDVAVAQVVQQQVARVGIRFDIEQMEWGSLVKTLQGTLAPLVVVGLIPAADPETNMNIRLASTSSINPGKTPDPELDALFLKGSQTVDPAARVGIYRDIQTRIADQAYAIFPAACPINFELWRSELKGYSTMPTAALVMLRQSWLAS